MTEEQRYQQKNKIEAERNKCLKGIWDELKDIRQVLTAIALGKAVEIGTATPRVAFPNGPDCSMTQYKANGEHDDYIPSNNCENDAGDLERAEDGWK